MVALPFGWCSPRVAALAPAWADAGSIASQRAAYVLSLGAAKANSGVSAIEGGMYIDWQEVCGGWTISQRMRFKVYAEEGEVIDNDISVLAGRSAGRAQLSLQSALDAQRRRGRAAARARDAGKGQGKAGKVEFSEPEGETLDLPAGTIFPTEHSVQLLKNAIAGNATLSRVVFDGASLDGALEINAVIGPRLPAEKIERAEYRVDREPAVLADAHGVLQDGGRPAISSSNRSRNTRPACACWTTAWATISCSSTTISRSRRSSTASRRCLRRSADFLF